MVTLTTDLEITLAHLCQVRNTASVTTRVFKAEVAHHVAALDNPALAVALAKLIDEMEAFEETLKREVNHAVR